MHVTLNTPDEVSALIRQGEALLLAGDIRLLKQLPQGKWIGGSTPYFLTYPNNRVTSHEQILTCRMPDYIKSVDIKRYDIKTVRNIYTDTNDNSFTILLLPFNSFVANEFALKATTYDGFATHPVCGWQSGRDVETSLTLPSHVICGLDQRAYSEKAVAMHVELPPNRYAELHIFNPYRQGSGDDIVFSYGGMTLTEALINGKKRNFAEYLREINYNPLLPLTADYLSAMINVSCLSVEKDHVQMYAPVFPSVHYRIAEIDHSIEEPSFLADRVVFSVTCILNFLQPDVVSRYLTKMNGPVGFGEIAYQLLNQTTVYVTVDEVKE